MFSVRRIVFVVFIGYSYCITVVFVWCQYCTRMTYVLDWLCGCFVRFWCSYRVSALVSQSHGRRTIAALFSYAYCVRVVCMFCTYGVRVALSQSCYIRKAFVPSYYYIGMVLRLSSSVSSCCISDCIRSVLVLHAHCIRAVPGLCSYGVGSVFASS